ncbi:MAG TPA: hypothetical protein VFC37_13690 [Terracidiphilus sp.]|nr:hypothetical protein [Terracidiphilus sp.]
MAKNFQPNLTPEEQARESIDGMLKAAGWLIQDRADANIDACCGLPFANSLWAADLARPTTFFSLTVRPLVSLRPRRRARPSSALNFRLRSTAKVTALVANQNTGSRLGAYNYALVQRELRNETAANAGFREALLMPDRQMAYHLARLALADGGNQDFDPSRPQI